MEFVAFFDIKELSAIGGFYLGVVDLSTCVTLSRILILYYVCPEETSELIHRPESLLKGHLQWKESV